MPDVGGLDAQSVISLQAFAGNAAVASLLARPGSTLQRAPAAAAAAPPAPPAAAGSPDQKALLDQLHNDSRAAAHDIREILTGNTYLGSKNQADIMAIVRHWAAVPSPPGKTMSGMDWLIAGLRQNTYEVGVVVKQTTSAFDELYRRMSSDNVAEFQKLVTTSGKQFKDDKPIELAKFEVSQEDIIRGLKAGGELAAAVATGGGSMIWQIISWLANTLPGLWNTIKSVFGLIESIKAFKAGGVGSRFNPAAFGTLAISALFGELQKLPIIGGAEPPKAEESQGEASGLSKVLMMIVHGITVVKSAYNKVAGKVNSILGSIDISGQAWFGKAAMVYAGITTLLEKIENPGAALKALADKLQEQIGGFFGKITGHIGEVVGDVKTKLEFITQPAQLLGMVADKLVSTVLNFIITHPPSELVRTVFQVIQTASGKELIEIVREQLKPIGDDIIKKIADSHVVQAAISPLKGPVHMVADAIGRVTEKGIGVVKEVQEKVAGFLSGDRLRELAGLGPEAAQTAPPAVAEVAAAPPADFLTVVKQGLHTHLMSIGMAKLIESGKALAKKGWEKVKSGAKAAYARVKGAIIGDKIQYEAGGEEHELWVEAGEAEDADPVVMVASTRMPLTARLDKLEAAAQGPKIAARLKEAVTGWIGEIRGLLADVKGKPKKLDPMKRKIVSIIKKIESNLTSGKAIGKAKFDYQEDSYGRPTLSTGGPLTDSGDRTGGQASLNRVLKKIGLPIASGGDTLGYQAGHLIATRFGGSGDRENLVPLSERVNHDWQYAFEEALANAVLKATAVGDSAYAAVEAVYSGDLMAQALASERKWHDELDAVKTKRFQKKFKERADDGTVEKSYPGLGPNKRRGEPEKQMRAAADAGDYLAFQENVVAMYTEIVRMIPDKLLYSVWLETPEGAKKVLFNKVPFPVEDMGDITDRVEREKEKWRKKAQELLIS